MNATGDDKLSLAALGGLAYLLTMLLHEGLGHAVVCAWIGGHPLLTSTATQCEVPSRAMVLAGPLLNLVSGASAWLSLRWASPSQPRCFWWLWLMTGTNLFLFAGYLIFCGLFGFGDWAVLVQGKVSAGIWRPLAVLFGSALYYGTLRELARQLPALASDPDSARQRLSTLTLYPYLGAGIVACAAGLFNPLGLTQSLILPVASSFGAFFGWLRVGDFRHEAPAVQESGRVLSPVTRSAAWLAWALAAIAAFVGLVGPGLWIRG